MVCYECQQAGKSRDAVALCHHYTAALCSEHALVLSDPVTAEYLMCERVVLPLRARFFLCGTCREALRQKFDNYREEATAPAITARVQEEHAVSA
jgi:hypothetical protein